MKKIGKYETTLQDAKSNQKNYKSNLNGIKREEENLKIDQISKKIFLIEILRCFTNLEKLLLLARVKAGNTSYNLLNEIR